MNGELKKCFKQVETEEEVAAALERMFDSNPGDSEEDTQE